MEVSKKVYQFANPVGKRNSLTVYNLEVIKIMEMIDLALKGKTLLTYTICKGFAKIEESGELEKMGFKTVTEFGKAIYGLETSTVNHYVRIGKNFITDDFTVKAGLPTVGHFYRTILTSTRWRHHTRNTIVRKRYFDWTVCLLRK